MNLEHLQIIATALLELAGVIAIIGGAISYLKKGADAAKKPINDVNEELDSTNKRLKKDYDAINQLKAENAALRAELDEIKNMVKHIVKGMYNLFEHLETGNNTGKMKECKGELFDLVNKK